MRTVIDTRGVSSGLANLVNKFCDLHAIPSPITKKYDVNERLPLAEWYRILNYLDQHYPKDDLGIELGKLCEPADIGIVAYLCMACETTGEVIHLFQRYQRIWYHMAPVCMETSHHTINFTWQSPAYVKAGQFVKETRLANDVAFTMMLVFMNSLIYPNTFKIKQMEFSTPRPNKLIFHERFFGCPVLFDRPINKLSYDEEVFNIKINQSYPDYVLKRILEKNADYLLSKYPQDISFNELLYRSIVNALQNNRCDIQYVAEQIGMSPRLLQHRLKSNGTSFSDKLNIIRKSLAFQYLEDKSLTINEISSLLAYHQQTSFNRALKLWTGMNSLQWRNEHSSKP
ncbi:AraC family transcriptional regulator ligand-binding domain-containing protein [Acinetobacter sp. S40]|uniref:AraC family transcriptional regulator n=1 Tax=Acinetobacter sp. S40 TaxID=2767434 RepID=UPI00190A92AD|nr:AraC family transcriptional regulator ligand-binding domain-containing protein [Acinetobacter sp. S40]MBJ9983880.1 AraC family transcriptional regulator ligand-binding domain-containing protein [Acinetobacter sp. S40]